MWQGRHRPSVLDQKMCTVSHLGVCALLGPPHDGVLCHDVIVVQDADDVREQLQQLAVLVAPHLQPDSNSCPSLPRTGASTGTCSSPVSFVPTK